MPGKRSVLWFDQFFGLDNPTSLTFDRRNRIRYTVPGLLMIPLRASFASIRLPRKMQAKTNKLENPRDNILFNAERRECCLDEAEFVPKYRDKLFKATSFEL